MLLYVSFIDFGFVIYDAFIDLIIVSLLISFLIIYMIEFVSNVIKLTLFDITIVI